jgi:hypothetical protein
LEAKQCISFFIINPYFELTGRDWCRNVSTLDNNLTNERLVIVEYVRENVAIYRHPIGASEEWSKEMANYQEYNEYRNITIDI